MVVYMFVITKPLHSKWNLASCLWHYLFLYFLISCFTWYTIKRSSVVHYSECSSKKTIPSFFDHN